MERNSQQDYIDSCYELFFENKSDFTTQCLEAKSVWFDIAQISKTMSKTTDDVLIFISRFKYGLSLYERISKFMQALNSKRINIYKYIFNWTTFKRVKVECEDEAIKNVCHQQSQLKVFLSRPEFNKYVRWFEINFFKYANHILDNKTKVLLGEMGYGDLIDKVYHAMIERDIKPKSIQALTLEERKDLYSLKSTDKAHETIRKLVWLDLSNEFFLHADTLTSLLFNKISFYNLIANRKHFSNVIEENIYSYEINTNLFKLLSKSSQIFKDCNIRFKEIEKALTLGYYNLSSFEPWDVDLTIFNSEYAVSQKDFEQYILRSLKCLGPSYYNCLKATISNIVKIKHNSDPSLGNIFIQSLDGDKYNLSLSNDGTIQGLFRASHCIGHFMNDYYIKTNNKTQPNILQNEISSMVNETLMFLYIRDHILVDDKYELCNAYYFFLKQMTNILSLCNMRLVLKDELNKMLETNCNNTDINYSETNNLFNRVKKHYEGLIDDEFRWIDNKQLSKLVNIGLLQETFEQFHLVDDIRYVIGAVIALNVSFDIYEGNKEVLNKYLKFLKVGNEISPIEAIKQLGIDLSNNSVYEKVKINLDKLIAEFKHELIGKNNEIK